MDPHAHAASTEDADGLDAMPVAYAKIASSDGSFEPFYITDKAVKETDEASNPRRIEIILGRAPPFNAAPDAANVFAADVFVGRNQRIGKRHAMIYWSTRANGWRIKSICKNSIRVNNKVYEGSADGSSGKSCRLTSRACIEIKGAQPLYFILPR